MKTFFTTISFLLFIHCAHSQRLAQVTFADGANLSYFSFLTDQGVLIRVSENGEIMEWGIEMMSNRYNYYAPRLQPFMGRIEYFGPEADSVFSGKVRSIGTCSFTYYGSYESDSKPGKLRSVGSVLLDYHSDFANKAFRGKLRFAGNLMLDYYSSFEEELLRGKLKSIGNTPIVYYSVFDDKSIRGKIKSIGSIKYSWYTSFDLGGMQGGLKSGSYRRDIGGVTYILR